MVWPVHPNYARMVLTHQRKTAGPPIVSGPAVSSIDSGDPLAMTSPPGQVRTRWRCRGSLVRDAVVLGEGIRARRRRIANVGSYWSTRRNGHLNRGVASDDVALD